MLGFPIAGLQPCDDVVVASEIGRFYCNDDFGSLFEQDVSTGELTSRQFDRQSGVTAPLAISDGGTHLIVPSFTSNALASWRLDGGGPIQRVLAGDPSIATYGYDSSDTFLESQETLSKPHIWNATTGERLADPTEFSIGTWAVAAHRLWVVWVASGATTGGLYDVVSASRVPGPDIAFDPLAEPIPVNDAAHGRAILRWPDHVTVFDQAGNMVGPTITGSSLPGHNVTSAWSSTDGTKIGVSAYVDGTSLYDATTGERLDVPALPFNKTEVSPNGVGVGSTVDGHLYTFDPDTLQILEQLPGLHGRADELHLSDDGTMLTTENQGDGVRIFDVSNRTQLGDRIADVDGALGQVSVRHDGKELAIPSASLGIVLWDLDPDHWLDAACVVAGRNLTPDEWTAYLAPFGPYRETCTAGHANR